MIGIKTKQNKKKRRRVEESEEENVEKNIHSLMFLIKIASIFLSLKFEERKHMKELTQLKRQPVNETVFFLSPFCLSFYFSYFPQALEKSLHMLERIFSPMMVLAVLPKLINHASFLMTRCSEGSRLLPPNEKELIGYCSYYHLLLYMCHQYPAIQEKIESRLQLFLQHNSQKGTDIIIIPI